MQTAAKKVCQTLTLAAHISLFCAGASFAESATSGAEWSRYVGPDALSALLDANADVQIIDIRSQRYAKKGAIPGAVWVPFPEWRGPSERPGQPPTEAELEALLGANGLRVDQPIVIHNHSGKTIQTGRAAIVYWILKSAGAQDIAILNGGFKAWRSEDGEIVETFAAIEDSYTADLSYQYDWWADPMDIFSVASGQQDGAILDARLDGQVRKSVETGKPLTSMPMAQYMPASFFTRHLSMENMSVEGQMEFRAGLEARGIDLDDELLISVCQTGELSALSWFYASEIAGIENVRYYPDALQGWESDGGLMFGLNTATN